MKSVIARFNLMVDLSTLVLLTICVVQLAVSRARAEADPPSYGRPRPTLTDTIKRSPGWSP